MLSETIHCSVSTHGEVPPETMRFDLSWHQLSNASGRTSKPTPQDSHSRPFSVQSLEAQQDKQYMVAGFNPENSSNRGFTRLRKLVVEDYDLSGHHVREYQREAS